MNSRAREFPVLPFHVHLEPTTGAQSVNGTACPLPRQCRKQCDFAVVALQQHLGNRRRAAEVPVHLKRRMIIKQVGQRGALQKSDNVLVRLFGVTKAGPEVDDPRAAPTGMPTAVRQPVLERFLRAQPSSPARLAN